MPGKTPIRFPTRTPKNDHIRFSGWVATPKPVHNAPSESAIIASTPGEKGKLQLERPPKHDDAYGGDTRREQQRVKGRVLAIAEGGNEGDGKRRRQQAAMAP